MGRDMLGSRERRKTKLRHDCHGGWVPERQGRIEEEKKMKISQEREE